MIEITNLFPLDPKFQVYPFLMKQCCFCEDTELVYGKEVCDVGRVFHNMVLGRDKHEHTTGYLEIILSYRQEYLTSLLFFQL